MNLQFMLKMRAFIFHKNFSSFANVRDSMSPNLLVTFDIPEITWEVLEITWVIPENRENQKNRKPENRKSVNRKTGETGKGFLTISHYVWSKK